MTSSWILNSPDGAGSYFGQFVADARQHRERPWRPFSAPQRFTLPESWTL